VEQDRLVRLEIQDFQVPPVPLAHRDSRDRQERWELRDWLVTPDLRAPPEVQDLLVTQEDRDLKDLPASPASVDHPVPLVPSDRQDQLDQSVLLGHQDLSASQELRALRDFKVLLDPLDCLERPVSLGIQAVLDSKVLLEGQVLWDLPGLPEVQVHSEHPETRDRRDRQVIPEVQEHRAILDRLDRPEPREHRDKTAGLDSRVLRELWETLDPRGQQGLRELTAFQVDRE